MLWFFPLTPSVCGDDYLTFPVMVDELSIMKYYREERDNEIDERERWGVWMMFIEWDGRSPEVLQGHMALGGRSFGISANWRNRK